MASQPPGLACSVCGELRCPTAFPRGGERRHFSGGAGAVPGGDEAPCASEGAHVGQCRVYFDPFAREWWSWWTCCRASRRHAA